ncbi:MAG TPA: MFS transporter [Candidatus Saccharimonadales bacterium]|nr:MFS transporter [Candidatus Saccharimonadales bacterium]
MAKIATAQQRVKVTQLDPTVRALGVVSLLNDLSSEVAVRTLPLFLANVLGVRTSIIGLIEGIGESTATLLRLVSGHLSDRIGKKKSLVLWGYSLSNLTKPLLYFATSWTVVLLVRFLDRVGKGIRTAPRDALIADVTTPENRGHAFGFNKAMDKTGGFIGVLLAAGLLYLTQRDTVVLTWESYRWLVLLSVLPGLVAVAIVAKWVEERRTAPMKLSSRLLWSEMGGQYWAFIGILTLFTLGNSSDAFLMLRAQTLGLSLVEIFLVVALFNLVISASSAKGGRLSDVFGRRGLIVAGWLVYGVVYLGLAYATTEWHVWVLYAAYGLYYGAFQGASSALIADLVPQHLRGTGYGIFNAALGVTALPASLLAGLLWDWYGPPAPFLFGAGLSVLAVTGFLMLPAADRRH